MRQAWPAMFLLLLGSSAALGAEAMRVENLRCEYLENPLGIDETAPRLSWTLQSDRRGQRQTAYQVLVASSPELLGQDRGDLWDSGRVASDETAQVVYAGKTLGSRAGVFLESAGVGPRRQTERLEPTGPLGIGPAAARRLDGPLDRGRPEGRSGRRRRVACGRPVDLVSRARGQSQGQGGARRPLLPPAPERPGRGETGVCVAGRRRRSRFHPVPQRQKTGSRRRRAELAIAAAIRREGVAYPRRQRAGGHGCAEV